MYKVTTRNREFSTNNARGAAEVAAAWRRRGCDVGLYVIAEDRNDVTRVLEVEFARSIKETAKRLVSVRRSLT